MNQILKSEFESCIKDGYKILIKRKEDSNGFIETSINILDENDKLIRGCIVDHTNIIKVIGIGDENIKNLNIIINDIVIDDYESFMINIAMIILGFSNLDDGNGQFIIPVYKYKDKFNLDENLRNIIIEIRKESCNEIYFDLYDKKEKYRFICEADNYVVKQLRVESNRLISPFKVYDFLKGEFNLNFAFFLKVLIDFGNDAFLYSLEAFENLSQYFNFLSYKFEIEKTDNEALVILRICNSEKGMSKKNNLIDYINNPFFASGKNFIDYDEDWYNPYFAITQTFSIDEIESMTENEINNLIRLAVNISDGLY